MVSLYGGEPEFGSRPTRANPYMPEVQVQRKRRIWPWILAAVVIVLCGFGVVGLMALSAGGKAVEQQIQQEQTARMDQVKITSCKADSIGAVHVGYTVKNTSDGAQDFIVQFNLVDPAGVVIGSASDVAPNVPAGATAKGDALGDFISEKSSKFKCVLVGA